jgi:hypothetical protein
VIRGTATITYLEPDAPVETLHVIPFDWMRYERWCAQHKIKADPTEGPASWGMYLAYSAYDRAHSGNGGVPGFDAWAQTVDLLDLDLETPDPTPPKAPAE